MKIIKYITIFLLLFIVTVNAQKKNFSVKEIFTNRSLFGKSLRGAQWFDNGEKYSFSKFNKETFSVDLYEHNVKTGKENLIVSSNKFKKDSTDKPFIINYYKWSSDNRYILFTSFLH